MHAAHTLKGSLLHLGETKVCGTVAELEQLARLATTNGSVQLTTRVERGLELFQQSLRNWLKVGASAPNASAADIRLRRLADP
jgi:hypothetical protein